MIRPYTAIIAIAAAALASCASLPKENVMPTEFLLSDVRVTEHRGADDLLSAGLGLGGVAGVPAVFVDPLNPSPAELRRRAIQMSWKGLVDLGPLGGFGRVYGSVPDVPGREYQAFARLPGARAPHRVLLQAPDEFDAKARCLVVTASSGSRGVYGEIGVIGAWALPRGCAVAYTDKAAGSGYFDTAKDGGVMLDGTRASAGNALLEFAPDHARADAGIAVKHAHSGDNSEADWGRDVVQAARFGLAMLDRAYPAQAPFTPENTHIIASGISNGGGAVLQAAGIDNGLLDGVVAIEPNIHVSGHGRALYDYATEAALLMPCALVDARFAAAPFARAADVIPPAWLARCSNLHDEGVLTAGDSAGQAAEAVQRLHEHGWRDAVIAVAATTTAFDVWRSVAVTYASAYLRRGVGDMPCGFHFGPANAVGLPGGDDPILRAAWWSDASGIPPGAGVGVFGGTELSADPTLPGLRCLRALWIDDDADAHALRGSVDTLAAALPPIDLPVWVVHGAQDGLIPTAFTSEPYIDWLRSAGRTPRYWKIPYAQHFDSFLALPGFGDRHVPLLPFAWAALDAMFEHIVDGKPLAELPTPQAQPRGAAPLDATMLDLPD